MKKRFDLEQASLKNGPNIVSERDSQCNKLHNMRKNCKKLRIQISYAIIKKTAEE
jgi:hypothetical protein